MPKKPQPENPKAFNFEDTLKELNKIVEKMEKGDMGLEESLKHFERGIALTRQCQTALKEAEQKVQILIEKDGQPSLEPYDTPGSPDSD